MDNEQFWRLIDETRRAAKGDGQEQVELLEQRLAALPVAQLLAFDQHLHHRLHQAYRADLWCAAYIINGGCSDDGFDYFRAWLIARGRAAFEAALADPDSLAAYADGDAAELEELLYAAPKAYEQATGRDDFSALAAPIHSPPLIGDLSAWFTDGEPDPDACAEHFPLLTATFLGG